MMPTTKLLDKEDIALALKDSLNTGFHTYFTPLQTALSEAKFPESRQWLYNNRFIRKPFQKIQYKVLWAIFLAGPIILIIAGEKGNRLHFLLFLISLAITAPLFFIKNTIHEEIKHLNRHLQVSFNTQAEEAYGFLHTLYQEIKSIQGVHHPLESLDWLLNHPEHRYAVKRLWDGGIREPAEIGRLLGIGIADKLIENQKNIGLRYSHDVNDKQVQRFQRNIQSLSALCKDGETEKLTLDWTHFESITSEQLEGINSRLESLLNQALADYSFTISSEQVYQELTRQTLSE